MSKLPDNENLKRSPSQTEVPPPPIASDVEFVEQVRFDNAVRLDEALLKVSLHPSQNVFASGRLFGWLQPVHTPVKASATHCSGMIGAFAFPTTADFAADAQDTLISSSSGAPPPLENSGDLLRAEPTAVLEE